MVQEADPINPSAQMKQSTSPASFLTGKDSDEGKLLNALPEACFVLDRQGFLTYANPAGEKFLWCLSGKVGGSFLGRPLQEDCPDLADSTFRRQCQRALQEQLAVEQETFYPALQRWFSVLVCPSGDRLCILLRDVNERTRLKFALRRTSEEKAQADFDSQALLLQFAAELSKGLTSVLHALQLIGGCNLDQDGRRIRDLAEREIRRLGCAVDKLLMRSRLSPLSSSKQRGNWAGRNPGPPIRPVDSGNMKSPARHVDPAGPWSLPLEARNQTFGDKSEQEQER